MNMICARCKKRVAVVFISRLENGETINEGLCYKCARELGIKQVDDMAAKLGISEEEFDAMSDQMIEMMQEGGENPDDAEGFEPGGQSVFPFLENLFGKMNPSNGGGKQPSGELGGGESALTPAAPNRENGARRPKAEKKPPKRKYLENYCENLTQKARDGKLDRIIGRDKEISRVVQILNRRTKNNPCLIGEPGVGKTAIAEGIALKISTGDVPDKIAQKELFLLDLTALVAGTQFRGQFESRVKGLIEEVKADGNVILFIDEVHNLVGTGESEGSMNAANILKPALSRGEIQVIGATTFNEYRKYIEKDAALERRFQPVKVEEPSIEDTIEVIKGVKNYYEQYHHVKVSDAIVRSTVVLSERYITDRFLPDKAIDLLDEACSCAELRNTDLAEYERLTRSLSQLREEEKAAEQPESGEEIDYERLATVKADILRMENRKKELEPAVLNASVEEKDVARVIELWTGIPASKIQETELKKVAGLEETLKKHLIGQDEAVELVSAAVRRSRIQINGRRRPASFIFVGPTGVGKTELVKLLSQELFDTADPLIRLDMSEFMEKHSVSRIVGAPPGYVGYDEAGQLTEKVRRRPYSVVLFDEIEKAHPDVLNVLLQILDEGRITDAQGRTVSFENTVIVMTSNAGSQFKESTLGFISQPGKAAYDKVYKALSEFLRPEFLGRVDEVVLFRQLDQQDFEKIAALMLEELRPALEEKGIDFQYDDAALAQIAAEAYGHKSGARDLRRVIRKKVEDVICLKLVENYDTPPTAVHVTAEAGALSVQFAPKAA